MFIRVVSVRYDPGQFEELRRYAQERVAPTLQSLPGFRNYTAGFDRVEGYFLGVSVWDTEEQAQAATEATDRLLSDIPRPTGRGQGQGLRYYEVIAQA